jgi:thiol-disulfide isomerase/thioredoxin
VKQLIALAALAVLTACSGSAGVPAPVAVPSGATAVLAGGTAAPDVAFRGLDDKQHVLSEFKGKPTAVALFAYWCPHCQEDLPKLQTWVDQTPGVVLLPIEASSGSRQQAEDFKKLYNIKADVYYGLSGDDFKKLGGMAYPTALLLSSDGGVVDRSTGMPALDKWQGLLKF